MIHAVENNSESQQHLEENLSKFKGDCLTVMKLLYSGVKLSAELLVSKYGISDRRLRDVFAARPDVIKKAWIKDKTGKRLYVQYWIEILTPTKAKAIEQGQKILGNMNKKAQIVNNPLFNI